MYITYLNKTGLLEKCSDQEVIEACGIIPHWFHKASQNPNDSTKSVRDIINENYIAPIDSFEMTGGKVGDDNKYRYPGDEPLAPYAIHENILTGEHVIQYPHGICALWEQTGERDDENMMKYKYAVFRID